MEVVWTGRIEAINDDKVTFDVENAAEDVAEVVVRKSHFPEVDWSIASIAQKATLTVTGGKMGIVLTPVLPPDPEHLRELREWLERLEKHAQ